MKLEKREVFHLTHVFSTPNNQYHAMMTTET